MDVTNFRPLALLTSFSKILEKVIYTRLYQHINQNNILAPEQYGFRNNASTVKASFKLINETLLALNPSPPNNIYIYIYVSHTEPFK